MRLSDLQSKKIINIIDGKNVGRIMDVTFKENGEVESFLIEQERGLFSLSKETELRIFWEEITKIGEDVILIKKTKN